MENKLIKSISFILLIFSWALFYFTNNKEIILLYFLLLINGFYLINKTDYIKILLVILFFLTTNILIELKGNENMVNKVLFIITIFSTNFLSIIIIGKLFSNLFKNKIIFIRITKIWLFTFIIAQLVVILVNKDFIVNYPYFVIIIFSFFYFLAGAYINSFSYKNQNLFLFIIFPLLLSPLIYFTSKDPIESLIPNFGIIFFSSLGFYFHKLFKII